MDFSITIGTDTVTEQDFVGLGYTTALPDLVSKIGAYIARLPYGSSTTTTAIALGTISMTVEAGRFFYIGEVVRVFNSVSNYMEGSVSAYNDVTGSIQIVLSKTVGSGTYSSWTVVPTYGPTAPLSAGNPIPVSRGGGPAATIAWYPSSLEAFDFKYFMQPSESNFLEPLNRESPYPFFYKATGAGYAISEANYSLTITGNYAGLWSLLAFEVGDTVLLSYGRSGYISIIDGGDLEFSVRIFGPTLGSGESVNFKTGLTTLPYDSALDAFSSFSFGFETTYNSESNEITFSAVVNDGTQILRQALYSTTSEEALSLSLRYSASEEVVRLSLTNEAVKRPRLGPQVFIVSLEKFLSKVRNSSSTLKRASLLKPFFFVEKTAGVTQRRISLDSFRVTHNIRREYTLTI